MKGSTPVLASFLLLGVLVPEDAVRVLGALVGALVTLLPVLKAVLGHLTRRHQNQALIEKVQGLEDRIREQDAAIVALTHEMNTSKANERKAYALLARSGVLENGDQRR